MSTHPPELKQRAKDLISTGYSVTATAKAVGVHRKTVSRWADTATKVSTPARNLLAEKIADDGENARLRRENTLLRQLVVMLAGKEPA